MSKYFSNLFKCCCNRNNNDLYHPSYINNIVYKQNDSCPQNDSYPQNDKSYDSEYYYKLYQKWEKEFEEHSDSYELHSTFYSSIPKATEV